MQFSEKKHHSYRDDMRTSPGLRGKDENELKPCSLKRVVREAKEKPQPLLRTDQQIGPELQDHWLKC